MIGRYYVQYFNFTYQRSGTLFEGRYKTTVAHPSEYPWSSYAMNALGAVDTQELLTPHREYLSLDADA